MVSRSRPHKNVHLTGCQASERLIQSSLGPVSEEGFGRLCSGKHLNNAGDPWEGKYMICTFCWCCIWKADGFRMSLDKIIVSKWAPFWLGLSVDHLYIAQDEQLLRPKSPNTSRISETWLGLHRRMLVQQSRESWHLCVITTAGVALFTCQLIITGFHLLGTQLT